MKTRTPGSTAQTSSLPALIEQAIGALVAEQQQAESEPGPFRDASSDTSQKKEETAQLAALGDAIARLQQIKEWLQSDQHLLTVLDEYVGKHVSTQTRKLRRQSFALSIITTIIGAILGWLLSILLPASLIAATMLH